MQITITQERPDTPDAIALITALEAELDTSDYPPESKHGYSVEKLIAQGVAFFVLRVDGQPAGCGGVQLFGAAFGELKRMYTRRELRGHGLAQRMLAHLEQYTRERGVPLLRLETGIHQHEAIRLYERYGFNTCPPFPPYKEDPLSIFYEKAVL